MSQHFEGFSMPSLARAVAAEGEGDHQEEHEHPEQPEEPVAAAAAPAAVVPTVGQLEHLESPPPPNLVRPRPLRGGAVAGGTPPYSSPHASAGPASPNPAPGHHHHLGGGGGGRARSNSSTNEVSNVVAAAAAVVVASDVIEDNAATAATAAADSVSSTAQPSPVPPPTAQASQQQQHPRAGGTPPRHERMRSTGANSVANSSTGNNPPKSISPLRAAPPPEPPAALNTKSFVVAGQQHVAGAARTTTQPPQQQQSVVGAAVVAADDLYHDDSCCDVVQQGEVSGDYDGPERNEGGEAERPRQKRHQQPGCTAAREIPPLIQDIFRNAPPLLGIYVAEQAQEFLDSTVAAAAKSSELSKAATEGAEADAASPSEAELILWMHATLLDVESLVNTSFLCAKLGGGTITSAMRPTSFNFGGGDSAVAPHRTPVAGSVAASTAAIAAAAAAAAGRESPSSTVGGAASGSAATPGGGGSAAPMMMSPVSASTSAAGSPSPGNLAASRAFPNSQHSRYTASGSSSQTRQQQQQQQQGQAATATAATLSSNASSPTFGASSPQQQQQHLQQGAAAARPVAKPATSTTAGPTLNQQLLHWHSWRALQSCMLSFDALTDFYLSFESALGTLARNFVIPIWQELVEIEFQDFVSKCEDEVQELSEKMKDILTRQHEGLKAFIAKASTAQQSSKSQTASNNNLLVGETTTGHQSSNSSATPNLLGAKQRRTFEREEAKMVRKASAAVRFVRVFTCAQLVIFVYESFGKDLAAHVRYSVEQQTHGFLLPKVLSNYHLLLGRRLQQQPKPPWFAERGLLDEESSSSSSDEDDEDDVDACAGNSTCKKPKSLNSRHVTLQQQQQQPDCWSRQVEHFKWRWQYSAVHQAALPLLEFPAPRARSLRTKQKYPQRVFWESKDADLCRNKTCRFCQLQKMCVQTFYARHSTGEKRSTSPQTASVAGGSQQQQQQQPKHLTPGALTITASGRGGRK